MRLLTILLVLFYLPLSAQVSVQHESVFVSAPNIATTTEFVEKDFAEGRVRNTGNNPAAGGLDIEYIEGATVVRIGNTDDTRLYRVTFDAAHPQGENYIAEVYAVSNENNGDEFNASVVEQSITSTGFDVITTVGDNGGTEDPQVFGNFQFKVTQDVEVIKTVTISN